MSGLRRALVSHASTTNRWAKPAFVAFGIASAASLVAVADALSACADTPVRTEERGAGDASTWLDASPVEAPDAATTDAEPPMVVAPSCERYCALVTESCTGEHVQYASANECMAFCQRLPAGDGGDIDTNSVACRQFYAGSPAKTDAVQYCLASGPFGGGICGDRCTSFCQLTGAICSDGDMKNGGAPYPSQPECASACAAFAYRDGGADGGGEGPDGPTEGDSLNCRLHELRAAIVDASACANLGTVSPTCR